MIVITSTTNDPGLVATAGYETTRAYTGDFTGRDWGQTISTRRTQNLFETGITSTQSSTSKQHGVNIWNESRFTRRSAWGSSYYTTNQTGRTTLFLFTTSRSTDSTPEVPASTSSGENEPGAGGIGTVPLQVHELHSTYLTTSTWVDYSTQTITFNETIASASSSVQGTVTQFGTFTTTRESTSRGIYGTSVGTYEDWDWDLQEYITITFPDTDFDNFVQQTLTSTYKTRATSATVTLDGARTFLISFPDFGSTLYDRILSSSPFPVSEAALLQTTDSLVEPTVYSSFDYQRLPFTSNVTEDSNYSIRPRMFVSTLSKEETTYMVTGQSVQTSQWREPVSSQYSTNTRTRFGAGVSGNAINIATGLSTYDAPTHLTTGVFTQSTSRHTATLITGTVTTTARAFAGNTTYTFKSFLFGSTFIPVTFEPPLMPGIMLGNASVQASGNVENTYLVTTDRVFTARTGLGFELVTRIYQGVSNGAEVGKSQMGEFTDFGMGMTGVPAGWVEAGRAFNYSAVHNEGRPIFVPLGGSHTTGATRYTGSVNANSATITRLITNFQESTNTTDSTSFEWNTVLPTVDPFFALAGHIHYLHPATHVYSGVVQVKNSDTTSTHTGFYSTAAAPGERIMIKPLVSVFPVGMFNTIIEAGSTTPRA